MPMFYRAILIAAASAAAIPAAAQTTYHVSTACGDDAWTGIAPHCQAPDGPKKTIQAALDAAADGDTVLVAAGTYTGAGNVNLTFNGHAVTLRSEGGPSETVLDGEGFGFTAAVVVRDQSPDPRLQGFTLTRFNGSAPGGAVLVSSADLTVIDCRLVDNDGHFNYGAGIVLDMGSATIINCTFERNTGAIAGAIFSYQGLPSTISNCTFLDNQGSLRSIGGNGLDVTNSVFRGGPDQIMPSNSVSYSNVEGGYDGPGNIDADPLFADPDAGDLRLLPGSSCIDAGDNGAVPDSVTTDIAGLPRFNDDPATDDTGVGFPPVVDMGAHEFQPPSCYADFTADGGLDLFDFLAFVNAFNADDPKADCDGDGSLTIFDFLCFTNAFNAGC